MVFVEHCRDGEREREGGREGRKRSGRRNGKELRRDTMHQKAGVIINSFYNYHVVHILHI